MAFALAQLMLLASTQVPPIPLTHPARRICRPGPPSPTTGQKSVLIIGDSISLGSMHTITAFLAPHGVEVAHAPFSGDGGALDTKYAMDTDVVMKGAGGTHPWVKQNTTARYGDGCLNGTFLVSSSQKKLKYDGGKIALFT